MGFIQKITAKTAAITVGISLLIMVILAVIGLLPLLDLIEFGEETITRNNIEDNQTVFFVGIIAYLMILFLDIVVAISLYIVFSLYEHSSAFAIMLSRLIYVVINLIAVIALSLLHTTIFDYATLIAYSFFIGHLFILGYSSYKFTRVPNWIGLLLIVASFSYIVLEYGSFMLSGQIYDLLYTISLIPASLGELTLGLYFMFKHSKFELSE